MYELIQIRIFDDISGDTGTEDVADTLVEHQLGRHAGIDATDHYGGGELSACGRPNLFEEIAVPHVLRVEADHSKQQ